MCLVEMMFLFSVFSTGMYVMTECWIKYIKPPPPPQPKKYILRCMNWILPTWLFYVRSRDYRLITYIGFINFRSDKCYPYLLTKTWTFQEKVWVYDYIKPSKSSEYENNLDIYCHFAMTEKVLKLLQRFRIRQNSICFVKVFYWQEHFPANFFISHCKVVAWGGLL